MQTTNVGRQQQHTVPDKWLLTVRKSAEQQLNVLKKLQKQAGSEVRAADLDNKEQSDSGKCAVTKRN